MKNFFKGIVIGLGAIAPGLSGSVLLVIFGLYQQTITAISTIFKDLKNNLKFLVPLALGIGLGILLFSKLIDYLLTAYEMPTRFAFLGFILGTIPLFYKEVKKQGFEKKYYFVIAAALAVGVVIFRLNRDLFPEVTDPDFFQSVVLGLAVAGSYIVPGVDSAAILSALGLYNLWVSSLAHLNFSVLLPAGVGLAVGVLLVSFVINKLIAKCYTLTFSIIFGLFLSIVPSVFNESCVVGWNLQTLLSTVILAVSFLFSLAFSHMERLRSWAAQKKNL